MASLLNYMNLEKNHEIMSYGLVFIVDTIENTNDSETLNFGFKLLQKLFIKPEINYLAQYKFNIGQLISDYVFDFVGKNH